MEHADASTPESGKNKEAIQNKAKLWLAISWSQIPWLKLLLVFLLIGGAILGWYTYLQLTKQVLYIALSGPMSGEYASNGETMRRAAELRISEINQNGGIDGKQVELLIFDDQNSPEKARENAQKIVSETRALAVIGHQTSSTSLAASPIYQQHGIPAISGTATTDELTRNSEWYFRTIFNNSDQAAIIANYISKVLGRDKAYMLSVDDAFGKTLADGFVKSAHEIGLNVVEHWQFAADNQQSFEQNRDAMVAALEQVDTPVALFIATHSAKAVTVLTNLRRLDQDILVFGPDTLSNSSFQEQMQSHPQERAHPGYYTDNVYATVPFIRDLGTQKAEHFRFDYFDQYGDEPAINSSMYYDVTTLVTNALKDIDSDDDLNKQRRQVRDGIRQFASAKTAMEGVTGHIYFDEHGDAARSFPMAVFRSGQLIPAAEQFQLLGDVTYTDNLLEDALNNKIIHVNGKFFSRAKVVYTGLEFNELSELDLATNTYTADIYLWFRFQDDLDDKNIEFINHYASASGVNNIHFEPVVDRASKKEKGMTTRTYQIKTKFKLDFDLANYPLDTQSLPIRFRHQELDRSKLIYVVDTLGMNPGLSGINLIRKLERNDVFKMGGWSIKQIEFFQGNQKTDSTLGVPELFGSEQRFESSVFNMELEIERNFTAFILKNMLPMIFIILVGYFVFYIPVVGPGFAVRITLGVNVIITTSLFHLRLASSMPSIDYLVLMEYLFYTSYLVAAMSILISVFKQSQTLIGSEEGEYRAMLADRIGRIAYPFLILAVVAAATYFYYSHIN